MALHSTKGHSIAQLPYLPCPGGRGGGATPTYMAQNDPHVALIILTTHMWRKLFREKNFPGQILCSGAFGGNIRPYTKQRAWHGSPFLEPPPPSFAGRPCHPPPPPPRKAIFGPPKYTFHILGGDFNAVHQPLIDSVDMVTPPLLALAQQPPLRNDRHLTRLLVHQTSAGALIH